MYSVGDTLPVDDLDSGAYLLAGPAMSGKYDILLSFLVEGFESGDGSLFVSTNKDAARVIDDIDERLGRVPERLRLVDCVSERGGAERLPADHVEYVSSPGDLTGVGIAVSEQLRRFDDAGLDRTRVAFDSLSTLLMYAELETVFRFLHVLTGRIGSIDGIGVFAVDPTTHEESTVNTLKQLFDGMIEVREADGTPEIRLVGVDSGPSEWLPRP